VPAVGDAVLCRCGCAATGCFLPPELLAFLVFLVLIFWSPFFRKCRFVIYPGHSMNYRFFR